MTEPTYTPTKRRFLIDTEVENTSGTQTWYVDAENEDEALALHEAGKSEFYDEEVEVTRLGPPAISGEVALTDFGNSANPAPLSKEDAVKVWNALRLAEQREILGRDSTQSTSVMPSAYTEAITIMQKLVGEMK
jgi:hypothetical protein